MDADANANANADARGSTIALCELCSGELKHENFIYTLFSDQFCVLHVIVKVWRKLDKICGAEKLLTNLFSHN